VTILTLEQIETTIEQRLKDAGMYSALNKGLTQFLSFPEGFFAEIVLNDASHIQEIEQILRSYNEELQAKGIALDAVVRAVWKISNVQYVGPARAPDGSILSSIEFKATLVAGEKECTVTVRVPMTALDELRRKLGNRNDLLQASSKKAESTDAIDSDVVAIVVRAFLEAQLAPGGTGYWDPIRHPVQELNEGAMLFLLGQSATFEELLDAVGSAFEPPVLATFLEDLSTTGIRIKHFDQVLPEFSNLLGGPYTRDQVFSTSASDMFSRLRPTEQQLIRRYFEKKVESLDPTIKKQFSKVFA
jgi:hypothetical protein